MTRRILRAALVAFILVILITATRFATLAAEPELPTPLLLSVPDPPAPFTGSDQRIHLVYELWITNFSSGDAILQTVEVLGEGAVLRKLDAAEITRRLQPAGQRESVSVLPKSTQAMLFIHLDLTANASVPRQISHRVTAHFAAAPPSHRELTEAEQPRSILAPFSRLGRHSSESITLQPIPVATLPGTRAPLCP